MQGAGCGLGWEAGQGFDDLGEEKWGIGMGGSGGKIGLNKSARLYSVMSAEPDQVATVVCWAVMGGGTRGRGCWVCMHILIV